MMRPWSWAPRPRPVISGPCFPTAIGEGRAHEAAGPVRAGEGLGG